MFLKWLNLNFTWISKLRKVKKNTLLIANTFGVHGRGGADAGSTRLALWGMGRTNPFIPFPGTGLNFFNQYQYKVLNWLKKQGYAR